MTKLAPRTLHLLRHAKSDWGDASLADHDRKLAPRGVDASGRVARHLKDQGVRPDLVLCSSARRTVETLRILALPDDVDVQVTEDLYGAAAAEILDLLRELDDAIASALVIGHNPGMHDLALWLAGDGEPAAMTQLHTKFPTAALATLDLGATPWARLDPGGARLASLVLPRDLP